MDIRDRARLIKEILGILGGILSAAKEHGIDTALAKSGIPVLQGLAAFNEWYANRRALKQVPDEVAEELALIYEFDASDKTREVIEQWLAKAGVDDPEKAYERAFRRLIARIKHEELVDFLEREFQEQRELFERVFGEISGGLRELVRLGSGKSCLRRIEDVLAVHPDPEFRSEWHPKWFRRTGPLAVDFDNGRVAPRPDEEGRLAKALDSGRRILVLEGEGATGKSVLARKAAYERFRSGAYPEIYYLDCSEHRDMDPARLCDEARDVDGLIVVEDAHLAPRLVSSLVSRLCGPSAPRLLLLTRPSLWDACGRGDEPLKSLRNVALRLEPFSGVDNVISFFAERHPENVRGKTIAWSNADLREIKRVSEKSFWLMAYALEGYVEKGGEGEPKGWVKEGVREELREREREDAKHPEILVALSPQYLGEVMTAERFLTGELGFEVNHINALVAQGEVKGQEYGDERYYGLPHSGLAEAYWRHGGVYRGRRNLPDYEDFLFRYAASGAPNAMEAVVNAKGKTYRSLMARLFKEGMIPAMIERERSLASITEWASRIKDPGELSNEVLMALGRRVSRPEDVAYAGWCIESVFEASTEKGRELWDALDVAELAGRVSRAEDVFWAGICIESVFWANAAKGRELWDALDVGELAGRVSRAKFVLGAGLFIWNVFRASAAKGRELVDALDMDELVGRVDLAEDVFGTGWCIRSVFSANAEKGRELLDALDMGELAGRVSRAENVFGAGWCIWGVFSANAQKGRELVDALDVVELAGRVSRAEDVLGAGLCIAKVFSASAQKGRELVDALDVGELARRVSRAENVFGAGWCIWGVFSASAQKGRELWDALDVGELARRVSRAEDVLLASLCIESVFSASAEKGQELWGTLDLVELAGRVSHAEDLIKAGLCIWIVCLAGAERGRELVDALDVGELAGRVSRAEHVGHAGLCIKRVFSASPAKGRELVDALDVVELAGRVSRVENVSAADCCIKRVFSASSAKGRELWDALDVVELAGLISRAKTVFSARDCIESVFEASDEKGRELWGLVDNEELKRYYREKYGDPMGDL